MFDFNAISANNGWAMSLVGVLIVFAGLILLSFAVSQIHKLLQFWDNRDLFMKRLKRRWQQQDKNNTGLQDKVLPLEVKAAARQFKLLTERLGEPFSLPGLLEFSEKTGLKRPHPMINEMLGAGLIVPDGKGYFVWDHSGFERKVIKE